MLRNILIREVLHIIWTHKLLLETLAIRTLFLIQKEDTPSRCSLQLMLSSKWAHCPDVHRSQYYVTSAFKKIKALLAKLVSKETAADKNLPPPVWGLGSEGKRKKCWLGRIWLEDFKFYHLQKGMLRQILDPDLLGQWIPGFRKSLSFRLWWCPSLIGSKRRIHWFQVFN